MNRLISTFKKFREEIFLALATIFMTGVLGLIIVESYYWNSSSVCEICQFHPELGWETIPSNTVTNGKVTYTTNSMGIRSTEVDPSREHILILGDSVAFGLGVNNNETISHYLEQDKRIGELGYQVLNMGVPGYGIGQYYLNLKRNIDQLNSKLIILILYTTDDLQETRQDNRFGISKPILVYRDDNLMNLNPNISRFSCLNLRTRLRFTKFLIGNCESNVIETNKASISISFIIDEIRRLGRQKNIPTLVVLSPAQTNVEMINCEQTKSLNSCIGYDDFFDVLYRYFQKLVESNKVPYIDFLTHLVEYSKEQPISSLYEKGDIHHYSPKGNYILAQTIANRLATDFDLNKPAPFSLK